MKGTRTQVYHNLSVMLGAGLPIVRALRTAGYGAGRPIRKTFAALAESVAAGNTLAETMAALPKAFSPLDVLAIEVGEKSGRLPDTLEGLAQWYAFRDHLRRVIQSGMLLPVLIFHIGAFVSALPGLFLGATSTAGYFREVASLLAVLYVPAAIVLAIVRLTPPAGSLRRVLDELTLKIPLFGRAVRYLALSRYCRAFHMLSAAGVPIIQCAEQSVRVTGNAAIAVLLRGGTESARSGSPLSRGFSRRLPLEFIQIWEIGEETGESDVAAARLADLTAQRAEWIFEQLAKWVPRLIYFFIMIFLVVQIIRTFTMIY